MEVKIALAQYPISQHASFEDWQQHVELWVKSAANDGAQLLVFPEYASMEMVSLFATGIQADLHLQIASLQSLLPGFMATFRHLSSKYNCIIVAPSFPVQQGQHFVNRCFVCSARGEGYQDKWFMTRFENEIWGICSLAKELTVFETTWGKFGIQICYDVEFPIGSHLLAAHDVELIVAPSCTETIRGATRVHVGARARAMEQQLYVGVSQTINEALWSPAVDINYGYAAVYSSPDKDLPPKGIVKTGKAQKPQWLIKKLDFAKNRHIKADGQVFNANDMHHTLQMTVDVPIAVSNVKI